MVLFLRVCGVGYDALLSFVELVALGGWGGFWFCLALVLFVVLFVVLSLLVLVFVY